MLAKDVLKSAEAMIATTVNAVRNLVADVLSLVVRWQQHKPRLLLAAKVKVFISQ
jgi:hypothetical protein